MPKLESETVTNTLIQYMTTSMATSAPVAVGNSAKRCSLV